MKKKTVIIGGILLTLVGIGVGMGVQHFMGAQSQSMGALQGAALPQPTGNGVAQAQGGTSSQNDGKDNASRANVGGAMNKMNSLVDMGSAVNIYMQRFGSAKIHSISFEMDGRKHYEIDGYTANGEESIKIDAMTGEVFHSESERLEGPIEQKIFDPNTVVALEQSLAMAREKVGPEYTLMDWSIEADHGKVQYKLELVRGVQKKEAIVDAFTGTVLRIEND